MNKQHLFHFLLCICLPLLAVAEPSGLSKEDRNKRFLELIEIAETGSVTQAQVEEYERLRDLILLDQGRDEEVGGGTGDYDFSATEAGPVMWGYPVHQVIVFLLIAIWTTLCSIMIISLLKIPGDEATTILAIFFTIIGTVISMGLFVWAAEPLAGYLAKFLNWIS